MGVHLTIRLELPASEPQGDCLCCHSPRESAGTTMPAIYVGSGAFKLMFLCLHGKYFTNQELPTLVFSF